MNVEQETLGFRRGSLSLPLSLLMSAFALPIPPAWFTPHLRRPTERSPTIRGQKTEDRGQIKTRPLSLFLLSFTAFCQSVQHFCDFLIFVAPLLPTGLVDID